MSKTFNISSEAEKWMEIFPYAVSLSSGTTRPVMLFKDKLETQILPVQLSPLDAGIAINERSALGSSTSGSPHGLTHKVLGKLNIILEKCFFTEVKGHHQFVELHFSGDDRLSVLTSRADEVLSFCLSTEAHFYCQLDYFEKCRILDAEMSEMAKKGLVHPSLMKNPHPYLN